MKNKGQALIEFILVIPIFILIIISIIDFGNIIYNKYKLENDIDIISTFYKEKDNAKINDYIKENNIEIKYNKDSKYTEIILIKKIKVVSLTSNLVVGDDYKLEVSKFVQEIDYEGQ